MRVDPKNARRSWLVGLVAVGAALLAVPASSQVQSARAPEPPRTGFEQRGGSSWTTQREETGFLAELDRISDRMTVSQLGTTRQGRPLRLVTVGQPGRLDRAQVAAGSSVLFLCTQHGNEPAGREACLQTARDLATDTSRQTTELLRSTTVLLVPTANPDGFAADDRENADGVDINRDHLALTTNETRATARVIRDWRPDVLHDLHEYSITKAGWYDRQYARLWARNRNVDRAVYGASRKLSDQVGAALGRGGYTTGIYGMYQDAHGNDIAQTAGDGNETILRNTGGLRHLVTLLAETNQKPTSAAERSDQARLQLRRVNSHLVGARAALELMRTDGAALARTTAQAAERATARGRAGVEPYPFSGADNEVPPPSKVALDPPRCYALSDEEYQRVRPTLELHGVQVTAGTDGYRVPLAQPAQPLVPLLLDGRAENELVAATPLRNC